MADRSRRRHAVIAGLTLVGAIAIAIAFWPARQTAPRASAGVASTTTTPSASTSTTDTTGSTTSTVATSSTTPDPPPYRSSISTVTTEMLGASYTPGLGCTEPGELRAIDLVHWGYDGAVHEGRIIVAATEADAVAAIFSDLYDARFPIERIEPIDRYGADDQASMRANNTSGYNCRTVAGTSTLSNHARGKAIDVNPLHNPYVKRGSIDPPEGEPWADRTDPRPGMIFDADAVVMAFAARSWSWGGYWTSGQDYQHFDT
ncbi:M15 family metallopeptidase [Actinospongicola halichondriae]|uniref:M15 family metallopeptidase n=1 Tax=Actinospongicola halichondriae TaxID=3236844 RepID=UPI003D4C3D11